jgi:chromosome segregation ATPase
MVKRTPKPIDVKKNKICFQDGDKELCQPVLGEGETFFGFPIGKNIFDFIRKLEYDRECDENKHKHELNVNATVSNIQNIKSREQDALIDQLMAQVSSLRREKERCEEALRNCPREVRVLRDSLDNCNNERERVVQELHQQLENLRTHIERLEEGVGNAEEQQEQSQKELADLRKLMTDTEQRLEQESTALREQLADAERRLADAKQRLADAEQTHKSEEEGLQQGIADLRQEVTNTKEQLQQSQQESENLQQQLAEAERRLAEAERRLADAKQRLAEAEQIHQSEQEDSQQELAVLLQEVTNTKQQLQQSEQNSNALKQQLAYIEQGLVAAEQQLVAAGQEHQSEQEELKRQLAATKEQLAETEKNRKRFAAALAAHESKNLGFHSLQQEMNIVKLEKELKVTEGKLDDVTQRLEQVEQELRQANDERNFLVKSLIAESKNLREMLKANKELEAEYQKQLILEKIDMVTRQSEFLSEMVKGDRILTELLEAHIEYIKEMSELKENLTRAKEEQERLQGEINVFRQELENADEQRQSTTAELQRQYDSAMEALRGENTQLAEQLSSCKDEFERLQVSLKNVLDMNSELMKDKDATIERLRRTLNDLQDRLNRLETDLNSNSTWKDWKSKLSSFKKTVERALETFKTSKTPVQYTRLPEPPFEYEEDRTSTRDGDPDAVVPRTSTRDVPRTSTRDARAENLLQFI